MTRTRGALALLLALLARADALAAQPTGELTARVTYAGTGEPIEGVLVVLPGLALGRLTDGSGQVRFADLPAGSHDFRVTLLGCMLDAREVRVEPAARRDLDLVLRPPVLDVSGLVVTGVAGELAPAETPFVVDRLEGGRSDAGEQSLAELLRGQFAGVRVVSGSGQPGDAPSIQLRGPTSIRGSQGPLIVVDGVITSGMVEVGSLDVQSVNVLKGAAAGAAYGSRGQAGVIEITTRREPAPRPVERAPVLVLDGRLSERTLADLDPADIASAHMIRGPAAALLWGPRGEAGVIHVETVGGAGTAARPPFCANPMW